MVMIMMEFTMNSAIAKTDPKDPDGCTFEILLRFLFIIDTAEKAIVTVKKVCEIKKNSVVLYMTYKIYNIQ
ncbi:hypothetical protein Y032_0764g2149 [Ancylostoma ceylanicum]|uniref:Uncharacterized protein n=1 Tax=Ancylostoma ceylanicum TaxID=53326 RepID=A0A016WFL6_9BILA|nr:hypothetical protein Y032_0764g2149 [Ancylostoma ceylanicum]